MFINSKVNFKSSLFSILFIFSLYSLTAQTYVLGTAAGYTTYRGTGNSNGATLQTCDCPAGKVIVGIEGYEGGLVDNFKIICATLNANGTLSNAAVLNGNNNTIGTSTGGNYYSESFTSPTAMVGYNIRVGDELDALTARGRTIAAIAANSANTSYTSSLSQLGANGGTSYNEYAPAGHVLIGVRFRESTYGGGLQFKYAPITSCTPATAPTSITGTTSICSGTSTTLTASGGTVGTGGAYQWYAGGCGSGTLLGTGASISVSPTTTTTYFVRRTATCGSTTTCFSVTVNVTANATQPSSLSSSSSSICAGTSITLTANGGSGAVYEWGTGTVGQNIIAGASNSTYSVSPNSTTTYWVRRKQVAPCSGNTTGVSTTVTVAASATAPTSVTSSSSVVCAGSSITLTANGGTGAVYEWGTGTVGQNIISGVTTASYTVSPNVTTAYWVRRKQVSPCSGNTAGVSITITISNSPTNLVVANGDYIWQGATSTDLKNRLNWMVFTSPNTYSIAAADISSTKNVFIPKLSTCVNSAFPVIRQPEITSSNSIVRNITILEDAVLTVIDEDLDVFGNWTNYGLFDHNNQDKKVDFKHSSSLQTIGGTNETEFYNLEISENNANNVVLNQHVSVANDFDFDDNRKFELGNYSILFLGSASITGENNSRYFVTNGSGVVQRTLSNSTFREFPVGITTYNPCQMNNTGTSDLFSVRVIQNVTDDGTGVGTTTASPVVNRTWMIDEQTSGGSVVDLRLYWNGLSEEINSFDQGSQFVAHHNNVNWENFGATSNSISPLFIQKDNISSFSPFTIGSLGGSPLPVELTSFSADCINETGIRISWSTASEHNSSHFDVLKSSDGVNWNNIAAVAAAGNSTSHLNYGIVDSEKSMGLTYYKLMQYDTDGETKEYGPLSINCFSTEGITLSSYPNPSGNAFFIELASSEEMTTEITITDSHGKVVNIKRVELSKGSTVYSYEDLNLLPGIYYIQITSDLATPIIVKHSIY